MLNGCVWEREGGSSEREVLEGEVDEEEKGMYADREILEMISEAKRSWREERRE